MTGIRDKHPDEQSPRPDLDGPARKLGFADGLAGNTRCPFPETDSKAWAWSSGWVEGDSARRGRCEATPTEGEAKQFDASALAWRGTAAGQPAADETEGMTWWNSLTPAAQVWWLSASGSPLPADAWNAYKRATGTSSDI